MTKLVVARHNEDVSWTKDYDAFIVQKDEHLPNIGREPSSYLWYIINHWGELRGEYVFLQGNPHEHCLLSNKLRECRGKDFYWFKIFDRTNLVCDMDGKPYDLVDINKFLELIGIDYENNNIVFNGCCLFSVVADRIKRRPKSFYENLYNAIMDNPSKRYEYAFERCVGLIFGE